MSELWSAEVLSLEAARVVIRLTVTHPDAGPFLATPTFALRLVAEQAHDVDLYGSFTARGPLGEQFRPDDVEGTAWCEEHASEYVASVDYLDAEPIYGEERPGYDNNWQYAKGTSMRYAIVMTDARWLEHLNPGQEWSSTVYA